MTNGLRGKKVVEKVNFQKINHIFDGKLDRMSGEGKMMYQIALSLLQHIGPMRTKVLLSRIGDAETLFKLSDKELSDKGQIRKSFVLKMNRKAALEKAKSEVVFIHKNGINVHYFKGENYPENLKFCEDAPVVLFSKGNIDFSYTPIAVVGTRKATPYGIKNTHTLIENLADKHIQIISGLAHGIDREAHLAAINNELPTIGVLGHGLDLIYPAAHRSLAKKMLENGGLITEFVSKSPGDPSNFPRRNRIVAGISQATVIVESGASGGSLITANLANDYNRDVFAFPGGINQPYSIGCNQLIKENKAHLITCAEDLIETMGLKKTELIAKTADIFEACTNEEEHILKAITTPTGHIHFDHLSATTSFSPSELAMHLFNLEMRGLIQSRPGQVYALA